MTHAATGLRRRLTTAALAVLLVTTVAACSSGSGESRDSGGGDAASSEAEAPARGADADRPDGLSALDDSTGRNVATGPADVADVADERKLISQGNVQLRSEDVEQALFDVQQVVDTVAGEVVQKDTATGEAGAATRARLVLRVPSARFDEAMAGLEDAADLVTSSSNVQDVTTKVLDVDIRVRVQRRSIQRIEVLLDQAESIRDIVAVERQLSTRQADLASLERQQAYLADQTAQATITLSIERTKAPADKAEEKEDREGFVAGLDSGWTGFKNVTVALATALGAALPFLLVLALLAWPARLLVRRLARRRTSPVVEA
ncbi:DUF4349 domain-containing protein [Nocardioides sp. cx-173]|uniref:DUF4349 domain-containing protein n=1 Tax=Nocardioides sp. cx-173 TaxID=2898796 RepID=UPI001E3A3E11|nr:DUF4349 domain-containing protein [Nocardioides sp. cx-173]MCD4526719.1 DUF4349 domain-containing protein [Nocardioides sp. cx-173]UGB42539.1 DUF4349 domain-containing protein [Nocardioides sp. cx-173]